MRKTFRYRIYPTKSQEVVLSDWLFLCSLVYNASLEARKQAWEERRGTLSEFELMKLYARWVDSPPWAERCPNAPSLGMVYAQVRNEVAKRVDRAFQAFFRRVKNGEKPGYPRFQSARRYDSFTFPQHGFRIEGKDGQRFSQLFLSKIGTLKVRLHRPLEGKIKTCTVSRSGSGWYVCFSCEVQQTRVKPDPTRGPVGLDMGLESFLTTSDGEHIAPLRALRKSECKLRIEQRRVSRRQKAVGGKPQSERRRKAVRSLAKIHERVANQRKDMAHKTARRFVDECTLIAVEDLRIRNMVKNHRLAKSISDVAWGQFLEMLVQKGAEAGTRIIKVNPAYTSQVCSRCSALVPKTLGVRVHACPVCNLKVHRDINAAREILNRALREMEAMEPQV